MPLTLEEVERAIHKDLVRWAGGSVSRLYEIWKSKSCISPFLLSWPATAVQTHTGTYIDGTCSLELPKEKSRWPGLFRQTIELTNPFAVLLCEQRESDVRIIFESEYGTRSWTLPIQRRGDALILGSARVKTDVESIGLLWAPAGPGQA